MGKSRKRFAIAFRRLADFAGLDPNVLKELSKLGKGYTSKSVEPRSLPRDEDITDLWESVKNPAWQCRAISFSREPKDARISS
jgi:hypothetical protein